MSKNKLVIIAGPTAIGKSDIGVELAKIIGGEIISADSMQVYKGMDIGTAKINKDEMQNIPHYLVDVLDPKDDFNIVFFKEEAKKLIEDINCRGNIPIIVGGTGFYIQSVLYDIDFEDTVENTEYRENLTKLAKEKGPIYLHDMLKNVDSKSAENIHYNDLKRVIRALEYFEQTGRKISDHNEMESQKESPYNYSFFVLNDDRERIYDRIDNRVDKMIELGLVDEVKSLLDNGLNRDFVSMKGLGYKEIIAFLEGEISLEEAIRIIKRDTRHFAKRQITWFKREKDVIWIDKDNDQLMLNIMLNILKEKGIFNN